METLDREEALGILEAAPVAHLGMIDEGRPYVTPMSFVVSGDYVVFRTMAGRKLDAIRVNPRVCVEASDFDPDTGDWSSVIVTGDARVVEEDDMKTATVSALLRKYESVMGSPLSSGGVRPLGEAPHFIAVEIDEVTGMTSGRGFSTRTRPGRL